MNTQTQSPKNGFNIASFLTQNAQKHPDQVAVICRHRPDCLGQSVLSYRYLDQKSTLLAHNFLKDTFEEGDRIVVMVPPGADFFIIIFAMFKAGLVPVMVDPGMGLKRMLLCLAEGKPKGLIGTSLAQALSRILPGYFTGIKTRVTVGRSLGLGGTPLKCLLTGNSDGDDLITSFPTPKLAAILFTSGATGPAKGTIYTHDMFRAQVENIKENFGLEEGGVDLATFPLFALFAPALNLTSVIPNMNPTKPGQADPRRIFNTIRDENVTSMFASPALLDRLTGFLTSEGEKLEKIKRIISAGAPVQPRLTASLSKVLPKEAKLLTPYGATEAMPLTIIEAKDIAEIRGMTEQGFGMCVGQALLGHQLAIIAISDSQKDSFKENDILPMGEIGEIISHGPVVSLGYFEKPEQTKASLITGPDGEIWRRMGDLGWKDARGRIWFCGRKNHRVVTRQGILYSICCESIFNNHPEVLRSALVGVPDGQHKVPVIVVEPKNRRLKKSSWETLLGDLKTLSKSNPRTRNIKIFLKYYNFPVDIRHNAKINRELLAQWAIRQVSSIPAE